MSGPTRTKLPRAAGRLVAQRVEVAECLRDDLAAVALPAAGGMRPFARLLLEAVARGELPGLVARVAERAAADRHARRKVWVRTGVSAHLLRDLQRVAARAAGSVAAFSRLALEQVATGHAGDAIRVVTDRADELRAG